MPSNVTIDVQRISEVEKEINKKMKRFAFDKEVILKDTSKATPELINALELIKLYQEWRLLTHRLLGGVDQRLESIESRMNNRRTD